jgi:hypothetical protein
MLTSQVRASLGIFSRKFRLRVDLCNWCLFPPAESRVIPPQTGAGAILDVNYWLTSSKCTLARTAEPGENQIMRREAIGYAPNPPASFPWKKPRPCFSSSVSANGSSAHDVSYWLTSSVLPGRLSTIAHESSDSADAGS